MPNGWPSPTTMSAPHLPGGLTMPRETASTPTISAVSSPMISFNPIRPGSRIPKELGCSTYTAQQPAASEAELMST